MKSSLTIAIFAMALLPQCNPGTYSAGTSQAKQRTSVVYRNTDYGFCVFLPQSWAGYSIILQNWDGRDISSAGSSTVTHGPQIAIRNPRWAPEDPHQDIPVMVFTHAQWDSVQHENLAVSAAPFPPSELGRNSKYVFGLPPRYNYAFPTGFKEVQQILKDGAFHAPCPATKK